MKTNSMIDVLQLFREYENDIPVGVMLCFLKLMDEPELTVSPVVQALDMSKQSASRIRQTLS